MEHLPANLDWDGIRIFLAVIERRSFRQAAADLGRGVNTVRQVIERLEDQLGFRLFIREADGVSLTAEGRRLANSARAVEQSMADLYRIASTTADTMKGSVRLAVTEGIGTFWIIPQLVDFLAGRGRDIQINLECANKSVDVLRLEADISIQLTEPTAPELIKRQLGHLHLAAFAGRGYASRFGLPAKLSELPDHRVVEQDMQQLSGYGLDRIFTPELAERMIRLRTNFASAHYWAVAKGAGIGMLPNYAIAIGGDLVPVELDLRMNMPIWLAIHPEVLKTARHRAVVDWLVECFSPERFPFLGPRNMHPAEITAFMQGSRELSAYFDGFTPQRLIEAGRIAREGGTAAAPPA